MRPLLPLLSAAVLLPIAGPEPGRPADGVAGDERATLFAGATFHTGFDGRGVDGVAPETVDALLVKDGRIVAIGSAESISSSDLGARAEYVDLRGAHVFPGFQDSHGHLERLGASLEEVDLVGAESMAELVRRVRERAEEVPAGHWIVGRGWDQSLWPGGEFPRHDALSVATPDHPVLVWRIDGVAALANARALAAAGLAGDELPEDPEGGTIVRFEARASGVLRGAAVDLVVQHLPAPPDEARLRHILRAQDALLAAGITCVHDMGLDRGAISIFDSLRDEGRLKLRVVGYVKGEGVQDESGFEGLFREDPRDVFTVIGVKFLLDGALGSRSAALLADYSDASGERGSLRYDIDSLTRSVVAAARAGLQPTVHAVGDRAVSLALDAYERAAGVEAVLPLLQPRIEHAQLVAASDVSRFRELAVVPSMQPLHLVADMRWILARLGAERAADAYPWKALAHLESVQLAFGSDFPSADYSPLVGLHAALTRQGPDGLPKGGFLPDERLTANEALAAYTSGAAAAVRQGDRRGRLAIGYLCDMTVVDLDLSDLSATTAARALEAKVLMTVVNGEIVHTLR